MANGSGFEAGAQGGVRLLAATMATAIALAGASTAHADLTVRQKITGPGGKALGERVWTMAKGKLRVEEGGSGLLVDLTAHRAWSFTGSTCRAVPMSADPTVAASRSSDPRAQRFADSLRSVTGAQEQLVQRDQRRTIAGVESELYEVVRDGEAIQRRWLAPSLAGSALDEVVQSSLVELQSSALAPASSTHLAIQNLSRGFPLRVENLATGVVFEAVEIRTSAAPPAAFTPPAGCPAN